jgi:hypothetical protein
VTPAGQSREEVYSVYIAWVVQREIDHLDAIESGIVAISSSSTW